MDPPGQTGRAVPSVIGRTVQLANKKKKKKKGLILILLILLFPPARARLFLRHIKVHLRKKYLKIPTRHHFNNKKLK